MTSQELGVEKGVNKLCFFTISLEAKSKINFSEYLFLLIHFLSILVRGSKRGLQFTIFLTSCYFFKIFIAWAELRHVFRNGALLHISLNNYIIFLKVSEYPELMRVKVRDRMMLRHRIIFHDRFCISYIIKP